MDKQLPDLLQQLEQEHQALEKLIDELPLLQAACIGDSGCEPASPLCRGRIRDTLANHLMLALRHFDHEHRVMHLICFPPELLEAHAVEHDRILDGINRIIGELNNGLSDQQLLLRLADLLKLQRQHNEGIDATLYRYLDERFSAFMSAA
jgi:hemerythrin